MADMSCSDAMTRDPVFCVPGETADWVAQLMKREDVGSIPVVESLRERKLVGIVTDRDLAMAVVAEGRDPKKVRIEEVMSRDPVTCGERDNLEDAIELMAEKQVRRIPIVDGRKGLVGIVSQADVATQVDDLAKAGYLVEEISANPAVEAE